MFIKYRLADGTYADVEVTDRQLPTVETLSVEELR